VQRQEKIRKAIDVINEKIEILNKNLVDYEKNMSVCLNQIPRDLPSLNTSNVNKSSR
jgi:hypothetical protein